MYQVNHFMVYENMKFAQVVICLMHVRTMYAHGKTRTQKTPGRSDTRLYSLLLRNPSLEREWFIDIKKKLCSTKWLNCRLFLKLDTFKSVLLVTNNKVVTLTAFTQQVYKCFTK